MSPALRLTDFLNDIPVRLRQALPPTWQDVQSRKQAHLVKLWYAEPRLHYEVWPVAGRGIIEVGLHFEADADINKRLLDWFDPHMVALAATLDGAVELEQWTPSWGHIFHVFHAPVLDPTAQAAVVDWLARFIPEAEPILQAALAEIGPVAVSARPGRDWTAWRQRQRRRSRVAIDG
jgi:hypothetical protein